MTTASPTKTTLASGIDPSIPSRILEEGYGFGAWHGPDLEAALADVTPAVAFKRPAPGRHNVAEVAAHHAWCIRGVIAQLTGEDAEPFPLPGEDWFELESAKTMSWPKIRGLVADLQKRLADVVADIGAGRIRSPISETERLELILGVTCHAVYHAGQVQLVKRLVST